MLKKTFEKYKEQTDKRIAQLEETVDFLAKYGKDHIQFVYKNDGFTQTTCIARYIYNGVVVEALIENFPYQTIKTHYCVENNRDYAIINSTDMQYKLDKNTRRCVYIKKEKAVI